MEANFQANFEIKKINLNKYLLPDIHLNIFRIGNSVFGKDIKINCNPIDKFNIISSCSLNKPSYTDLEEIFSRIPYHSQR